MHVARANSTVTQYKDFTAWVVQLHIKEDNVYTIRPELVTMYLMYRGDEQADAARDETEV